MEFNIYRMPFPSINTEKKKKMWPARSSGYQYWWKVSPLCATGQFGLCCYVFHKQNTDEILKCLIHTCVKGWPYKARLSPTLSDHDILRPAGTHAKPLSIKAE